MTQEQTTQRIPFTCTLDCGSRCELVAHVRDGDVVRVDTPAGRPDTATRPRLIPCARGRAQGRARHARDRVLHPLRCVGPKGSGQFEQITWEDALDEIAEKLRDVQARYGTEAVLHATGAGAISGRGFSGSAASSRFFSHWGAVTGTIGGMSNHCASIAAQWMLGRHVPGSDRATLRDSRLIILWGMNPAETHMGPNTGHFIGEARDRGARVILIDPRYTDSAILADQWIPIRPGTDAALAAAIAYVLETEDMVDRAFVASNVAGYEPYRDYVLGHEDGQPKTPTWAERKTGIAADTIAQLARDYGSIKPAALLPGWAPQRTLYGEQIARALIALACLSGNVGIPGGGLASVGTRPNAMPVDSLAGGPHNPARYVYVGSWAKAILDTPLDPPITMAYIVASNLINRSPDTRANARALSELDTVVVHDPFLTPTARCADIVLPICTELERTDLVTSWGHDLHLFYNRQTATPAGEARTDYWVFAQLAARLGFGDLYAQGKSEAEWIEAFLEPYRGNGADSGGGSDGGDASHRGDVAHRGDAVRRWDADRLEREGVIRHDGEPRAALADFRADPVAHPLPTPSGKIEFSCPQAQDHGLPPIPSYIEIADEGPTHPLQLITPHYKFRSNSCLYAVPWLQRLEQHAVWISAQDAAARGIADGDPVEAFNQRGTVRLPAKVTERIMPGVVCIYQGAWYRPGEDGVDVGGCANVLTEQRETPSGGFTTHTTWIDVRRSES